MTLQGQQFIIIILCYWAWCDEINYVIKYMLPKGSIRPLTYLGIAIFIGFITYKIIS